MLRIISETVPKNRDDTLRFLTENFSGVEFVGHVVVVVVVGCQPVAYFGVNVGIYVLQFHTCKFILHNLQRING